MKRMMALLILCTLILAGCAGESTRGPAPLIPMKDFFRNPDQTGFDLSPDGANLAFLSPWENRQNIHVRPLDGGETVRITESTARDIGGFFWANNERIVYIQDTGGDENWHLFAVNLDGSNFKELTPFEGVRAQFVDPLRDNDDEMLISMNKRNPQISDVYRIDINTGEMEMVAVNPGNIMGWVTDNAGKIRIATTTDGVNNSVLYRKTEDDPFEVLITTNFKEDFNPLFFAFDDKLLYVASNLDRDKDAIYTYDPETRELKDLIFEHAEVDVRNLMRSRERKVITGVSYTTDKRHYHFFDKEREGIQNRLEAELPGLEAVVVSLSRDERKILVRSFSDKTLGGYYYWDRDADTFEHIVDVSPWLNSEHMADMTPIRYQSRDGLTIHGYLTLPVGVDAKNLPVVVNPHGGPWARDNWGFNPEVQLLANRGYAVLQMNFRGSTGYGKAFWSASFKEWGRTMQDDITDGVQWLIDQGIADPERIGIYGGSYGGYAVLAGLTFTPDLYACGVDYVGVSNLFTFMQSIPPYWEPFLDMIHEMVGDPETDEELMRSASPFFHVDKIKAPLFVAQGANDPRVDKSESDQIVEALKARGIDVPYMVKGNEGHGFMNEENRWDFYGEMEQFLGKHLGGAVEEPVTRDAQNG